MASDLTPERRCRFEHPRTPLFSDEQLRIWHDVAASGHRLAFNAATMETLLDEVRCLRSALDAAEARTAALCEAGDALLPAIEETDFIWMDAAGHYELRCQICDAQAMGTRDRAAAIEHRESCEVRAWRALRGSGEPTP